MFQHATTIEMSPNKQKVVKKPENRYVLDEKIQEIL